MSFSALHAIFCKRGAKSALYVVGFLQTRRAGGGGAALPGHARPGRTVQPAVGGPVAPAGPQVVAHVHTGRGHGLGDVSGGQALLVRAVEVAPGRLPAPPPPEPVAVSGSGSSRGHARRDAVPALVGLAGTFPLAPGDLVAPPPPGHA